MVLYLIICERLPEGKCLKVAPPPDVWEICYPGNHPRHGKEGTFTPNELQSKCEQILDTAVQDYQECNPKSAKKSVAKTTFLDSNKDFRGCIATIVDTIQLRVTYQARVMGN